MLNDSTNRDSDSFRREPAIGENALAVPEADPERIAFNLWNEGRVDEAIQFLEREIARKRERYEAPAGEAQLIRHDGSAGQPVEPVSDWRDRHRSLSPAEFNAFGATVRTIDITPGPADAILPHPRRRSARAVWLMGLGLIAILGASAGATFWSGRDAGPEEATLPAARPAAAVEPAVTAPAESAAETDVAAVDNADVEVVAPPHADAEAVEAPPPEDETLPPEDEVALEEPDLDSSVVAPETTASVDPAPAATEATTTAPAATVEARLPRPRVEPPANLPVPTQVAEPEPVVVYAPEEQPAEEQQAYLPPSPAPFFDPANPPPTLTPAEYQALMERRAFAEDYSTRRRAVAERRAMADGRRIIYFDVRRP